MNENHKRRIRATFEHVDTLLRTVTASLSGEETRPPFGRIILDTAPVQRQVIQDYADRTRALMKAAMDRFGIEGVTPSVPASRSACTFITGAEIGIQELEPKALNGYGPVSPEEAQALADTNAELLSTFAEMRAFLGRGRAAGQQAFQDRLPALGALGALLEGLDHAITRHGLVALRPSLDRLVASVVQGTFEIAVFGRVSSGKSTFLNHLLGEPVLPVGVTPVTALVTRVVVGPERGALVRFAQGRSERIGLAELPDFVTEQSNPGNRKQVDSVQITLPSARLGDGVAFVDTPGLGSLAGAGAAETLAYLPRADLGLLLLDASGTPSPEDLAVLGRLVAAGANCQVLLSKGDLLSPQDRAQVLAFAETRLAGELGFAVPVHLVSTVGAEADLAERWLGQSLRPLMASHERLREEVTARKTRLLVEATLASLLGPEGPGPAGEEEDREAWLRRATGALERARRTCGYLPRQLLHRLAAMLAQAAEVGSASLAHPDPAGLLDGIVQAQVQELHRGLLQVLDACRESMDRALGPLPGTPGASALPPPLGMPRLEAPVVQGMRTPFRPPLGFLGRGMRRTAWARHLQATCLPNLRTVLEVHKGRLEAWGLEYLDDLEQEFKARSGPLRAMAVMNRPSREDPAARESLKALEALAAQAFPGMEAVR